MKTQFFTFLTAALLAGSALAEEKAMDHSSHGQMDHGDMKMVDVKPGTEASGVGVLNSIDAANGMVNLTHEPMPELGWPTMTMDIPVTKHVDLGGLQQGEKIDFRLKLGRDKQYRIIEIAPAKQ